MLSQGQPHPKCDANITRIRGYRSSKEFNCPKRTEIEVTLVIDNVTASDSGNYTCTLENWFHQLKRNVTMNAGRSDCELIHDIYSVSFNSFTSV